MQSEQVVKGMLEQSRASREMTTSIEGISQDVRSISRANRSHLEHSVQVLNGISDVRKVTVQNAASAQALFTGAKGLTDRARRLTELMTNMETRNPVNGNVVKGTRRRTKKAGTSEGA